MFFIKIFSESIKYSSKSVFSIMSLSTMSWSAELNTLDEQVDNIKCLAVFAIRLIRMIINLISCKDIWGLILFRCLAWPYKKNTQRGQKRGWLGAQCEKLVLQSVIFNCWYELAFTDSKLRVSLYWWSRYFNNT